MFILTKLVDLVVAIILFGLNHVKGLRKQMIVQLKVLKRGLAQEKNETKYMLKVYRDFLQGRADRHQLVIAHQQMKDIIKAMGLGALLILPFSVLTLPILVKLAEKLGINLFPSAFTKGSTGAANASPDQESHKRSP